MPPDEPAPNDLLHPHRRDGEGILDLALALVRYLRAHDPWDARQTARSLVPFLMEEAHETVAAIRQDDASQLEQELGDLLLNIAFQIVIAEESELFDATSLIRRLDEKMRRRHPHLFGQGGVEGWEGARARERDPDAGVLTGVGDELPPLLAAHRIQQRVAAVGFDWPSVDGALEKLEEEVAELRKALHESHQVDGTPADPPVDGNPVGPPTDDIVEELGDVFFAAVNVARLSGTHADDVLDRANRKFRRRFEQLEALARERSIAVPKATLDELDALWDEVKSRE